jgi:hypothetical protein
MKKKDYFEEKIKRKKDELKIYASPPINLFIINFNKGRRKSKGEKI